MVKFLNWYEPCTKNSIFTLENSEKGSQNDRLFPFHFLSHCKNHTFGIINGPWAISLAFGLNTSPYRSQKCVLFCKYRVNLKPKRSHNYTDVDIDNCINLATQHGCGYWWVCVLVCFLHSELDMHPSMHTITPNLSWILTLQSGPKLGPKGCSIGIVDEGQTCNAWKYHQGWGGGGVHELC